MGAKDGRVAIIGASMAGLLAARVLADIASEVLIIERDTPPEQPESRKGVPQGRHAHALLRAGALIIEDLSPGLMQDLVARGAQRLSWLASGLWWQFDGYRVRHGDDFELTTFTRPFLEDAIRKRVAALPNVRIRSGISARGILEREGQVNGVVIGSEDNGKEAPLDADLVIDASGRGSQAGEWLKALGHMPPPVDEVRIDMPAVSVGTIIEFFPLSCQRPRKLNLLLPAQRAPNKSAIGASRVPGRAGEGILTEPTAATQPWRRQPLLMPHFGRCVAWTSEVVAKSHSSYRDKRRATLYSLRSA